MENVTLIILSCPLGTQRMPLKPETSTTRGHRNSMPCRETTMKDNIQDVFYLSVLEKVEKAKFIIE
jgi:hypothetical protein